jgi:hypothetical protein
MWDAPNPQNTTHIGSLPYKAHLLPLLDPIVDGGAGMHVAQTPYQVSNLRFEGASKIISTLRPCPSTPRPLGRWLQHNPGITVQPHWDPIAFEVLIVVQDNALYGGLWPSSHARAIVEY